MTSPVTGPAPVPERGRPVDPARLAALEVLEGVSTQDAYANLLLPARLREHGLTGRDAAFATELVAGTLRGRGTYDAVIVACARRPLDKLEPRVVEILRLGTHQGLRMRVPPHAAVATSVDLARRTVGPRATGFVNGVLRAVLRRSFEEWVEELAPAATTPPLERAVIEHAHPRWVVTALQDALDAVGAAEELTTLLAADNTAPAVTLVARPGLCTVEELLRVEGATPTTRSPWGVVLAAGDPGQIPAVVHGRAAVQDEGSQLVTRALVEAPVTAPDRRWLDLCAGPGGKAALLGAVAAQRDATLVASERQPHRARLVRRAVRALPRGTVATVVADGTVPAWSDAAFDRVLVDAPCTGLGALRRRPESRWRRTVADLDALVPLQRDLLVHALDAVRPGGLVAYVTCSPVLAETAGAVEHALAARPGTVLEDAVPWLGDAASAAPDVAGPLPGTVQLWPHRHGTDAMFLALLRRP